MRKEQELLDAVLWPQDKNNVTGNLVYSNSLDFVNITNVSASRTNETLEIFYCTSPLTNPEDKTYFVKLYLNKDGDGYVVDYKKSSPELKTEEDIQDVLATVKNAIIKMNTKPLLFTTGVIAEKKLANKM